MLFKNVILASILLTLLIMGSVESSQKESHLGKRKRAGKKLKKLKKPRPSPVSGPVSDASTLPPLPLTTLPTPPPTRPGNKVVARISTHFIVPQISHLELSDVISQLPDFQKFKNTLDENVGAARKMFHEGSDIQKRFYGECLVGLEIDEIVDLFGVIDENDGTGDREWVLQMFLVYAKRPVIDAVFEAVKPSDELLVKTAFSKCSVYKPEGLIYLLKRITVAGYRKKALNTVIDLLFEFKAAYRLQYLIHAIEGDGTLDQDLKNTAIRLALGKTSVQIDKRFISLAQFYCGHPSVSSDDYSHLLINAYEHGHSTDYALFKYFLGEADPEDLNMVKNNNFSNCSQSRGIIERVMKKKGYTRRGHQVKHLCIVLFDLNLPGVLINIIIEYFLYQVPSDLLSHK